MKVLYPINNEGVDLLKDYEKFWEVKPSDPNTACAYWDALGSVWTCAWGFTLGVTKDTVMTREEADIRLAGELSGMVHQIKAALTIDTNENELAAMAVLCWNIGLGWEGKIKPQGAKDGFRQSTVLKAHNRGDKLSASRAFGLWNKSGGHEVLGLTRRRAAEKTLYLKPVGAMITATPQKVDEEKPLAESPIAKTATAAGITSTLSVGAQVIHEMNPYVDFLHHYLPYVAIGAGIACVGLAAYVVYQRIKQRKEGWV